MRAMSSTSPTCLVVHSPQRADAIPSSSILKSGSRHFSVIQKSCDAHGIDCIGILDMLHDEVDVSELSERIVHADLIIADLVGLSNGLKLAMKQRTHIEPNASLIISIEESDKDLIETEKVFPPDYRYLNEKSFPGKKLAGFSELIDKKLLDFLQGRIAHGHSDTKEKVIQSSADRQMSFKDLIKLAEKAKSNGDIPRAKRLFRVAQFLNDQDVNITQRLCLVTYKENESSEKALKDAFEIIQHLHPEQSDDPETIGLSGAIFKRLYEVTKEEKYFQKSLLFYNKGYEINRNYYNGINLAFSYNRSAALIAKNKEQATRDYEKAKAIRKEVLDVCLNIVKEPGFESRDDKNWVYLTLAEAYLGFKMEPEYILAAKRAKYYSEGVFDRYSFERQCIRLLNYLNEYKAKYQDQA